MPLKFLVVVVGLILAWNEHTYIRNKFDRSGWLLLLLYLSHVESLHVLHWQPFLLVLSFSSDPWVRGIMNEWMWLRKGEVLWWTNGWYVRNSVWDGFGAMNK